MRQLLSVLLLHVLFAASFLFASASTPTPAAPADYPSRLQAMLAGETLQGNSPTPAPTSTPASPTVADAMAVDADNACYQPQYVCSFPGEPYKTLVSWLYGWCMAQNVQVGGALKPRECFWRLAGWDYPWDGLLTVDGYEADYGVSLPGRRNSGGGGATHQGLNEACPGTTKLWRTRDQAESGGKPDTVDRKGVSSTSKFGNQYYVSTADIDCRDDWYRSFLAMTTLLGVTLTQR